MEERYLHNYRILDFLGEGASARVYLVQERETGKQAAAKIVPKSNRIGCQALRQEWDVLSMLDHPGIPRPIDRWEEEESMVLIMTLMPGETPDLSDPSRWIEDWDLLSEVQRRVTWEAFVCRLGYQVCDILAYLHERPDPLIYGDLKPGNLRLRADGVISLVDLGSVSFLSSAAQADRNQQGFLGTIGYAAPEQYPLERGHPVPETDLYALGRLLEVWMGEIPLSPALGWLTARCQEAEVSQRWHRAASAGWLLWILVRFRQLEGWIRRNW